MRILDDRLCRIFLIGSMSFTFSALGPGAFAQQAGAQTQDRTTVQTDRDANANVRDDDTTKMDQFMDDHKDIAKDLRKHPESINDDKYLRHHRDLRAFLDEHPRLRENLREHPEFVMHRENRVADNRDRDRTDLRRDTDARADANVNDRDRDARADADVRSDVNGQTANDRDRANVRGNTNVQANENARDRDRNPNPDITGQELVATDQFLDSHQDIDRDLQAHPSLINDSTYLQNHPALQSFLNEHPGVREEVAETPSYFIYRADRIGQGNGQRRNPNPDITRRELAETDHFLDEHPAIDRQLQANPALVNDSTYLKNHPDLQTFLNTHPGVREEITETPKYFIYRTEHLQAGDRTGVRGDARADANVNDRDRDARADANVNDRDRDVRADANVNDRDRDARADANVNDRDRDRGRNPEFAKMDQFLDDHPKEAKQLASNPGLIENKGYLKHHSDLRGFLEQHPEVREAVLRDRTRFSEREEARLQELNLQQQQQGQTKTQIKTPTTNTTNKSTTTPPAQTLRPITPQ
jgi:hypothetical protein